MFKKIILISFFYIPSAFSLILVEPYGGLQFGDTSLDEKSSGTTYEHDGWNIGVELGGRLGINIGPVMFGGEFNQGWVSFKTRKQDKSGSITSSSTYNNTLNRSLYGGFFGLNLPVLPLKFWGNYFIANGTMSYAEAKGNNLFKKDDKLDGAGWGVGVGITSIPFVNLIVTYRKITYDKWETAGSIINLPDATYTEFDVSEFFVGISIPFDFL